MSTKLDEVLGRQGDAALLQAAKRVEMTPEQREQQRRSFAYGNANIDNDRVTRAVVDEAATKLDELLEVAAARTLVARHAEGEYSAMLETLTSAQARGTKLLDEARAARRALRKVRDIARTHKRAGVFLQDLAIEIIDAIDAELLPYDSDPDLQEPA